jgi:hypothetical protein
VRIDDARVPVTNPPHSRDHADIDRRFSCVTGPAQHLTVLQRDILRQCGRDDVIVVEPPDLKGAWTAAAVREHTLAAPVSSGESGPQNGPC